MNQPPHATARTLLLQAAALYDAPDSPLPAAARLAASGGFAAGAKWMALALTQLRGAPPPNQAFSTFHRLGLVKYALAVVAALTPFVAAAAAVPVAMSAYSAAFCLPLALLAAALLFYIVEVQFVFLFPAAIDASPTPFATAFTLTRKAGGTRAALIVVLPLAAHMLFAGFRDGRFLRAWALGCLAVCLWYEHTRAAPPRVLIREERVAIPGILAPLTLLYASDLHLGRFWTAGVPDTLLAAARLSRPDVILLGGDLADTVAGLAPLATLTAALTQFGAVLAIPGNHDILPGLTLVRQTLITAGVHYLPDVSQLAAGILFTATVPDVQPLHPTVLVAHDPALAYAASRASLPLVLAGHLHGGQCVLHTSRGTHLYPGYLLNRLTVLRTTLSGTTLLVSRGLADTLPLRLNCPAEVLLVRLERQSP